MDGEDLFRSSGGSGEVQYVQLVVVGARATWGVYWYEIGHARSVLYPATPPTPIQYMKALKQGSDCYTMYPCVAVFVLALFIIPPADDCPDLIRITAAEGWAH